MRFQGWNSLRFLLALGFSYSAAAMAGNLHLIEENSTTGYAVYRTGEPNLSEFKQLCALGVTEMFVLSGTAGKVEDKFQSYCPQMRVVYNVNQDSHVPLSKTFLDQFDAWVSDAKLQGKKIAFRCNCGCHRTGRLAAYFQMKFQNMTVEDALILMNKHGKWMLFMPHLIPQVKALGDYLRGKPCSQEAKYCVRPTEATPWVGGDDDRDHDSDDQDL